VETTIEARASLLAKRSTIRRAKEEVERKMEVVDAVNENLRIVVVVVRKGRNSFAHINSLLKYLPYLKYDKCCSSYIVFSHNSFI
jgi:hypothetical protein